MPYRWNNFQVAAFICWGLGGILILIPAALLYAAWSSGDGLMNTSPHIVSMLIGVVSLATGGTLHKVGQSRER
jgi:hypothetical protein